MVEASSYPATSGSIAFLLHPSMVPVIDVFRSLSSLEDQYDLSLLDGPEQGLTVYTQPEAAKGIVSDALLLAFALTRQRGGRPFLHRPLGSRHGSVDEYCLLALMGSLGHAAADVALEAAAYLDVASLDAVVPLVGEIVRQMDSGALVFEPPSLSDFRAMMSRESSEEVLVEASAGRAEFNFRN
jgi:hypothetical protein